MLLIRPPAVSAGTSVVAGPAVHSLLDVRLVGAAFVWELLLLSVELGRVEPGPACGHARSHRVPARIHWVAAVGHRVPQHLDSK